MTKKKNKRPPAPPSTPTLSTKGEPIPPGYHELVGGAIVKEPPGWKEVRKRWAKHDKPDGKKAFRAIAELEDPLADISRCADLLYELACVEGYEDRLTSSLILVANVLEDALGRAEELRGKAHGATWGFEYGDSPESYLSDAGSGVRAEKREGAP